MTMVVSLSDAAQARADEMVRSGRYTSLSQVVQAALTDAELDDNDESWMDETVKLDALSPDHRAAVEEGLADIEAGKTRPAKEVFADLRARIDAMRR